VFEAERSGRCGFLQLDVGPANAATAGKGLEKTGVLPPEHNGVHPCRCKATRKCGATSENQQLDSRAGDLLLRVLPNRRIPRRSCRRMFGCHNKSRAGRLRFHWRWCSDVASWKKVRQQGPEGVPKRECHAPEVEAMGAVLPSSSKVRLISTAISGVGVLG